MRGCHLLIQAAYCCHAVPKETLNQLALYIFWRQVICFVIIFYGQKLRRAGSHVRPLPAPAAS
jgi:hypothetical protein